MVPTQPVPASGRPEPGPCHPECALDQSDAVLYQGHRLAREKQGTSLPAGKVAKQTLFYQVFIVCISLI